MIAGMRTLVPDAKVVDLFCGVGGMTYGFIAEGFRVVAGIDLDASCKYAYEKNNRAKFVERDVSTMKADELLRLFGSVDRKILIGCAPCQPFSAYSQLKDRDEKWKLLHSFSRLVSETKPEVVSMENVQRLVNHRVFTDFIHDLKTMGYHVSAGVADGRDYGVPQSRRRLVLLASLLGPIEMLPPTHRPSSYRTVADVIQKLPPLRAGGVDATDPLHQCRNVTEINLRRLRNTSPGGGWSEWPLDLRLECHKAKSGKTFRSVYGRMRWDEPAPTITTQFVGIGNGRFGHPEQDRAISLREAALLQTFPRTYEFVEPDGQICQAIIARHIGNAVPPRLGRIIGRSIRKHLELWPKHTPSTIH